MGDSQRRRVAASPRRRVWLFLFIISCSKITDPLAQPYVKEFRITGTTPGREPQLTVTSGAPGRLNLVGAVPVPSPCYLLEPDVAIRGNAIQLTIYARPPESGVSCQKVLAVINYEAVLGDFTKDGQNHLIVSHDSGAGPIVDFMRDVIVN